jgi:hypothetical protein
MPMRNYIDPKSQLAKPRQKITEDLDELSKTAREFDRLCAIQVPRDMKELTGKGPARFIRVASTFAKPDRTVTDEQLEEVVRSALTLELSTFGLQELHPYPGKSSKFAAIRYNRGGSNMLLLVVSDSIDGVTDFEDNLRNYEETLRAFPVEWNKTLVIAPDA